MFGYLDLFLLLLSKSQGSLVDAKLWYSPVSSNTGFDHTNNNNNNNSPSFILGLHILANG